MHPPLKFEDLINSREIISYRSLHFSQGAEEFAFTDGFPNFKIVYFAENYTEVETTNLKSDYLITSNSSLDGTIVEIFGTIYFLKLIESNIRRSAIRSPLIGDPFSLVFYDIALSPI